MISIPNLSPDGVSPIHIGSGVVEFQTEVCGPNFGIEGATVAQSLVCELFFKFYYLCEDEKDKIFSCSKTICPWGTI